MDTNPVTENDSMVDSPPSTQISAGEWKLPDVSYVDPARVACEFCGRPIPRRYWSAEIDGTRRSFCDPSHAQLYVEYWIPTWGKNISSESDSTEPRTRSR